MAPELGRLAPQQDLRQPVPPGRRRRPRVSAVPVGTCRCTLRSAARRAATSRSAGMGEAHILLRRSPVESFSSPWLAVLLLAGSSAFAAGAGEARAAVRAALEQEATAPALPPVLPSLAAERAGKRGEAVPPGRSDAGRMAREQGEARANSAAATARSEAAARAAEGAAASAAKNANADSHAAAGQARANAARKKPHGPGKIPAGAPGTSR